MTFEQEIPEAAVYECIRKGCRDEGTEEIRRGNWSVFACPADAAQIEADDWAGWVVDLDQRRKHPVLEVYKRERG